MSGKVSVASVNGAGGFRGALSTSAETLTKFLGAKEHLDWLNIDLNAAKKLLFKIINSQKINMNGSTYIVVKLRVKQVKYETKI